MFQMQFGFMLITTKSRGPNLWMKLDIYLNEHSLTGLFCNLSRPIYDTVFLITQA